MSRTNLSRRKFLAIAGTAGAGLGLAACAQQPPAPTPTMEGMDSGSTTSQGETFEEMDKLHKDGVVTFVDYIGKDTTFWRQPALQPTMDGNVKVFNLTCTEGEWEVKPGQTVPAMMYNGMVPGPEIRATEGDTIRIVVKNEMKQSTSIHFHGVHVENKNDGVPFITQDPITPGMTFTYEMTLRNSGSHMYHSHHNAAEQVTKGLMGAFIIEPKDKSQEPTVDADYTMLLNDTGIGLTINGKSFPYTQPIVAKKGQKIRVRYMNEGLLIHPFHLHGMPQLVIAKDGYNLSAPYLCDTLNVAPGERYDVIVECTEAGVWAYHCHILTHAESARGMFGMVTALVVQ